MQQPSSDETLQADRKIRQASSARIAVSVFVSSIILTLAAIFVLADWAETSMFGHGLQHVLIFVAGCGAGGALFSLRRSGHEG